MTANRRRWLRWTLGLALGYAVFGFFIAPWIVRGLVLWQLPKKIGRPVSLQKVNLNPFTISIALDGFGIAEADGKPFVGWDEVYVNLDPTGLIHRELVVSQIAISNAFGHVQANRDGSFNFSDILKRFPREPVTEKKETGQPLVVRVGELRITGSRVVYDDFTRATPFNTTVGPIDVTLHDFSTSPDHKDPYAFTAVTESGETFSWSGHFYLGPIRSEGEFAIAGIALKKYAPYYDEFINLTLHDGKLDVSAAYRVEFTDKLTLAQVSNLTVAVRSLKIAEHGATQDVIEIPDITLTGATADAIAQTAEIPSLAIRDARLNSSLVNIVTNLPALASRRAVLHWDAIRLAGIRAQAAPVSYAVESITLTNAGVDYADAAPQAAMAMSQINATVLGLTSSNAPADLRVTGHIGNLGSFEATGRINPMNMDTATELQATLHAMDLVPVGPYAGQFAGYDVRRGKLNVSVKYSINDRKLDAQNSIEVDQFTFGDVVESPDATKLPVKLAVAILKDRNGKITLDVPVEGRIDDPKFRYWGAVWHVLGNLFTKIFTAPFSMLGSMFGGGGEELGWQEFAPGSSELLPEQVKKLDVLIKAMSERPGLNVEIEGNVDKAKDLEPLKRRKLHEMAAQRAGTANDYVAWLRTMYAEALPEIQAKLAPPPPPPPVMSNVQNFGSTPVTVAKRARKVASELSEEEMERGYFEILSVTDDEYRRLAVERAERVRRYLLEAGHVDAERVFLADLSKRALPAGGTRAVFGLQ